MFASTAPSADVVIILPFHSSNSNLVNSLLLGFTSQAPSYSCAYRLGSTITLGP